MPPSPIDDWNLLRTFLAVFDAGTLTQAARQLGMTQPSAGRHLRSLEERVGEPLFDRVPGQWRPTERAAALYERAAPMRDAAQVVDNLIGEQPEQVAGVVRLSCSEAFSIQVLPPLLASLMHAEPRLQIELVVSNDSDNLIKRDADIAVRFYRPLQDGLVARRVGSVEVGLFASASYLEQHGTPSHVGDPKHVWIGYDRSTVVTRAAQARGAPVQRTDFRFRTDSVLAQQAAIEAGLGIGPCLLLSAARRPVLRRVLADAVAVMLDIWMCAHEDLKRSVRLRRVFDHLVRGLHDNFGAPSASGAEVAAPVGLGAKTARRRAHQSGQAAPPSTAPSLSHSKKR